MQFETLIWNWRKRSRVSSEMRTIFFALVIQCYISVTFEQAFEITRPSHGRDEFNIPASMCSRNGTDSGRECKSFYAVDGVQKCSCLCPARNATFAFYNKGWSCVENRNIRRYLARGKRWILFNLYNVVSLESLNVWTRSNKNSGLQALKKAFDLKLVSLRVHWYVFESSCLLRFQN